MARKSRKTNWQARPVTVNIPITVAVGYVRLSVEDRGNKGDSIETQKKIILKYIEEHSGLHLLKIYEDDGVSGGTYERPGFSKMIQDAENGMFSCILIKDVSRLGRNLIDTGYYVEKMLPSIGVRVISITDNYDSVKEGVDTNFALKSLFSEVYLLDIGRKVKSAIRNQMENGQYIGSRPPYGYLKSPEDKHRLVVDEEAAVIVKQIFQWAADGKSAMEIVRSLNCAGIVTPSHHWFRLGIIQNVELLGGNHWQSRTVRKLLANEAYTGTMVRGKTKIAHRRQMPVPQDEWIRVENIHPAIISQELFATVQKRFFSGTMNEPKAKQQNEQYTPNLFKGKIFCGHCGGRLDRKKNHQHYIYRCTANYVTPENCSGNSIREETIISAVSRALLEYAGSVDNEPTEQTEAQDAKPIETELAELQVGTFYDENAPIILYETFIDGKITKQDYLELKAKYNHRKAQQEERWVQLSLQKAEQAAIVVEKQDLLAVIEKFQNTQHLTPGLIGKLVERIEVFGNGQIYVRLYPQRCLGLSG
jgi:DNA invertase Pin-like site-specific DNA recombinase